MTVGMKMFLLAAQELNFTKAAQKAYVTPQCLSDHIKRLENEYGVLLFHRHPRLSLTAEGQTMFRYFTEVQSLEISMKNELAGISGGARGTLRLGMPTTRGQLFVPQVIPEFQAEYPCVNVEVHLGDTRELEPLLAEGKLDLIMGVSANPNPLFDRTPICRESLYAILPESLMQQRYGRAYLKKATVFGAEGLDVAELAINPLVLGSGISTTALAIQDILLEYGLQIQSPIVVSNFDILLDLCFCGKYATICLMSNIRRLLHEKKSDVQQDVFAFPLKNCDVALPIELLSRRHDRCPPYQERLITLLKDAVLRENELVQHWLINQKFCTANLTN